MSIICEGRFILRSPVRCCVSPGQPTITLMHYFYLDRNNVCSKITLQSANNVSTSSLAKLKARLLILLKTARNCLPSDAFCRRPRRPLLLLHQTRCKISISLPSEALYHFHIILHTPPALFIAIHSAIIPTLS